MAHRMPEPPPSPAPDAPPRGVPEPRQPSSPTIGGSPGSPTGPPRAAVAGLLLTLLLGCWLVIAPFAVSGQPRGGRWTPATRDDVTVGATVVGISLLSLLAYLAAALHWLAHHAPRRTNGVSNAGPTA
jgi:hypothetical protein